MSDSATDEISSNSNVDSEVSSNSNVVSEVSSGLQIPMDLLHTTNGNGDISDLLDNHHINQDERPTNGFGYHTSEHDQDDEITADTFVRAFSVEQAEAATNGHEDVSSESTPDGSETAQKPEDQGDAWGFGGARVTARPDQNVAQMPVERDAEMYNMNHKRRGLAIIFNHKNFDPRLGLKTRNGTDADRDNLRLTLRQLDFEVKVFDDLPFRELERILEETSNASHADADCIMVAVLSHGELGILYASDHAYKPDRLWTHFNAERCPTLAGKPKMFFIQACQGDQLDAGVHLKRVNHTETDSNALSYKIPSHADFLIAYSTIPGFYSWRNTTAGSWFVQALCHVLQRYGTTRDLLSNLTRVARKVAFDFQSNTPGDFVMHEKKQIPCITSMLTRDIFFASKS